MALRKQDFPDNDKQKATKSAHIAFSITPELLHRIETAAAQKKLSIDDYLESILDQSIPSDAEATQDHLKRVTPEFLQKVYQIRERIQRESGGKLFEDSTEVVRRMREERTQYLDGVQEQE